MTARFFVSLALSSLLSTIANATDYTREQVADSFLHRGLLTKEQHQLLRSNTFLDTDCSGAKLSSCAPKMNLMGNQCGITGSVDNIGERPTRGDSTALLDDIDSLRVRVDQYPDALRAYGKWDASAEQAWLELKEIYAQAVVIANSNSKRNEKLRQAKPLLERAEDVSVKIAKQAGYVYEGGCGAPGEDSAVVSFSFSEQPRSALYILQMEFDACKRILADPYDSSKCEAWTNIQQSNELSGNYRYRVTWSDNQITEKPFNALSRGRKTIQVSR